MRLVDVPSGSYVTRPWNRRNNHNKLRIFVYNYSGDRRYVYRSNLEPPTRVPSNSSAWTYDDFVFCDIDGNILKTQPNLNTTKDTTMATLYSAKIIVATNSNVSASFNTEAEALEWVAGKLEEAPRTKFKMFKPYQSIEPKIPDLSSLIKKIED